MKYKGTFSKDGSMGSSSSETTVLVPQYKDCDDYESFKGSLTSTNDFKVDSKEQNYFFNFIRRRKPPQTLDDSSKRSLNKDGTRNFHPINIHQHRRKFTSDIFTTLLELKWRWIFVACFITYFGSWLFFAGWWYLIVLVHGDLDHVNDPTWSPCVTGVMSFASVFLFSVETQHTIGYGFYHVTEQCPSGVLLLCLQSIVGVILEGIVVGLVFLKISRAKKRSETLMFSRNAVICHRDGKRYFMFRVADTRTSHLLEAHVRAQIVRKRITPEGELVTHTQQEIKVGGDGEKEDKILLFWPTTVIHEIDSESPLADIKPSDLRPNNKHLEIIVVLEGVVETTGLMTQARSSYAPHEIRWGSHFREIHYKKSNSGQRIIDYSIFDDTIAEESQEEDDTHSKNSQLD